MPSCGGGVATTIWSFGASATANRCVEEVSFFVWRHQHVVHLAPVSRLQHCACKEKKGGTIVVPPFLFIAHPAFRR